MDNVTHTLAGMLLAEAVCVWRRESRTRFRSAAYLTAALANNLPDIDFVYTWITTPKPLGSLLHHRGHTHTLLIALPFGLFMGWAVMRWLARKGDEFSAVERRWVLGLALVGSVLHLLMDYGNNYGVHPFWPLSGGWFYGDTIFIVEPLWWAMGIPVLALSATPRWLKVTLLLLLVAVLLLGLWVPFVTAGSLVAMLLLSALSLGVAWKGTPRQRIGFGLAGWVAVAACFSLASLSAERTLRQGVESAFPALRVHDLAKTPMPSNPFCYTALVVGEQGSTYRVLTANVATFPSWVSVEQCPFDTDSAPTARFERLSRADRPGLRWLAQYRAELPELRALWNDDCRFRALMKFARVPYVTSTLPGGGALPNGRIAGDLRYDRSPDLDFADLALPGKADPGACPRFVPGWSEPRADLFR